MKKRVRNIEDILKTAKEEGISYSKTEDITSGYAFGHEHSDLFWSDDMTELCGNIIDVITHDNYGDPEYEQTYEFCGEGWQWASWWLEDVNNSFDF